MMSIQALRGVRVRRDARRHAGLRGTDTGTTLVLAVGAMMLISAMSVVTLGYALSSTEAARRDQDAKTAMAAAQAGIDEYVSRLTADSSYWTQGNSDTTNPAFTAGQRVQGSVNGATYTYQVLSTMASTATDGTIRLLSTGTSSPGAGHPNVSRTLITTLKVTSFLQYLYLSDIEVVDPAIVGSPSACANYYYAGRSSLTTCSNIQWGSSDVVNGPLHSNDALQINGSVNFTNTRTESSWPAISSGSVSKTWWGTQNPPLTGRSPVYAASVSLPSTNSSLLNYVSPDVNGTGTTGAGCYYQGATEIIFQGASMRIRSPMTSRADTPSRCLNVATRSQWQIISPIPPVIYVDSATSGSCTTGNTAAFTYPRAGESYTTGSSSAVSWGPAINYHCKRGSVYVQGVVASATTVATADDVVVTGNLTVDSLSGSTVVGLIAGNCAWVYHPVNASGNNIGTPVTRIDAALLALRHSFLVENWASGNPLGSLTVNGAITQEFRGPVGTSSGSTMVSGYVKNYVYDARLANLQPPYFLQPTSTPWRVVSVVDG
jgi:type II secretory pathway pseudopilin PulG